LLHICTTVNVDLNTDFTINRFNNCSLLQCLKYFMNMFHFKQLICDPTRISSTSCTTIYLILASDCYKICQSGVINTSFNDHTLIYCTRKAKKMSIG